MTIVYSRKGDIPKAFEYLQKSLEAGFTNIKRLEEDTDFSPLRDLPEWNALMKKYFPNMMKISFFIHSKNRNSFPDE